MRLRRTCVSLPSSVRSVAGVAGEVEAQLDVGADDQGAQLAAQDHEQLGQREVVELELEPPGLDLGDVEQVADQPQLVLGDAPDERDLRRLLADERRLAARAAARPAR